MLLRSLRALPSPSSSRCRPRGLLRPEHALCSSAHVSWSILGLCHHRVEWVGCFPQLIMFVLWCLAFGHSTCSLQLISPVCWRLGVMLVVVLQWCCAANPKNRGSPLNSLKTSDKISFTDPKTESKLHLLPLQPGDPDTEPRRVNPNPIPIL
jgi:hypothetical protein